ncbi:helix-turn-helix domain-containing protein [uncultured Croceitalea sp.]|uniref:helix-turn-helix domain-containing protein n=1 Tax=uncultured Croceitalea sp. TaxID=1798908 RepID=UPI003305AF0A
MAFSFLNTLLLVGTIQGLITSIVLFNLKSHKSADTILSALIFLISLACLNIYLLETIEEASMLWNIIEAIVPLVIIMPIGPLVYFYVKSTLGYPDFKLEKKDRVHFYSTLLDLIPYVAAAIYITGGLLGIFSHKSNAQWANFIQTYQVYVDIPRWLSLTIYIYLTFKIISLHEKNKRAKKVLKRAKRFTIGFSIFAAVWLIHLIPYIIPFSSNALLSLVGWYPIYIPLIILVYWIGNNGIIISVNTYRKTLNVNELSHETIKRTMTALQKVMEEDQLFLDPSLKLNDIVTHTNIKQKTISTVLNQYKGKTFNEFVNGYRIEKFKSRLLKEKFEDLTITGIAFECGFNSQATFQRTFKSITQQSPSEFLQKHSKNTGESYSQI